MIKKSKIEYLWQWLVSQLSSNQRIILASIIVGVVSSVLAVSLKLFAHYILVMVSGIDSSAYLHAILPLVGIFASLVFMKFVLKKEIEKGTFQVIYAIAKKSGKISKDQTFTHVVTAGLTVGLGGSAGLESPIVQTGAAVGSTVSDLFPLNYRDRTLMIGCGAAAGIAAAFNAPIAGVLFALEVLLANASIHAFIPLIIAGATGALLSKIILNETVLFHFQQQAFDYHNVPYYLLLGIFCGLFSAYYTQSYIIAERLIMETAKRRSSRLLFGGGLLAMLILLFPPLFGEGYASIKGLTATNVSELASHSILANWIKSPHAIFGFLVVILFVKVWATSFTISAGGNGGSFAPSLFAGGFLGFLFAQSVNYSEIKQLPLHNFTLVGMAGVLSGVFHAPLTGIFLIAEITGGYDLIIPLMIVSSLSLLIARYIQPHSLDAMKLAQKGYEHSSNHDTIILSALATGDLIEDNFQSIHDEANLGELITLIAKTKRNTFPVVDSKGRLKGVILLDQLRDVMFKPELYATLKVKDIQQRPLAVLLFDESMSSVMEKFDRTNAWNLPVLRDGKYAGFISKSMIFSEYRKWLQENSYR